jgi:hypothetical protein
VPAFLVPAAPDDPARGRIGGGIGADPLLRFGERIGVGEVELQRAHAELHDVAVRVDQAWDQGPAAAVEEEARPVRAGVAALIELADAAVVADPHPVEPVEVAVLADRIAVDIVDQYVGEGGRGGEHRQQEQDLAQHEPAIRPLRSPRQMVFGALALGVGSGRVPTWNAASVRPVSASQPASRSS